MRLVFTATSLLGILIYICGVNNVTSKLGILYSRDTHIFQYVPVYFETTHKYTIIRVYTDLKLVCQKLQV